MSEEDHAQFRLSKEQKRLQELGISIKPVTETKRSNTGATKMVVKAVEYTTSSLSSLLLILQALKNKKYTIFNGKFDIKSTGSRCSVVVYTSSLYDAYDPYEKMYEWFCLMSSIARDLDLSEETNSNVKLIRGSQN